MNNMIKKIPVPLNLLKSSLGIRDDIEIVKATVSGDAMYLYTIAEINDSIDLSTASNSEPMRFSVSVNETN